MKVLGSGHLRAGWDSVLSSKLRSFWTMLGIIIGVASVITIVSIGEGVKQQVSGQLSGLSKDLITIRPAQISPTGSSASQNLLSGLSVSGSLTSKDVATAEHTQYVAASVPLSVVSGTISGDHGEYRDGFVVGTSSDMADLLRLPLAYGTFLTTDDMGINAAVIGKHAADKLFDDSVPLGRSFYFHGHQFIVRGIFNDSRTALFSQQVNVNNAIFIPYDVGQQLANNTAPTYQILIKTDGKVPPAQVTGSLSRNLNAIHGGQSNLSIKRGSDSAADSSYILELLTRMIAGIAAISLLVGGVGIMNVMLVSVAEREHEIGIRKAVGATNRQILNQFLAESTVLSLLGGVIGIIVALLIDVILRTATDFTPLITWQVVVVATVVSLLVGMIFGTAPALKAARKDPIEALRGD